MQANAGGGSSSLPAFLQDTKVQIGVGVVALLAIGFLVWNMIGPSLGSSAQPAGVDGNVPGMAGAAGGPAGYPGSATDLPGGAPAGYPGSPGGLNGGLATDSAPTAVGTAPKEGAKKAGESGPKPPNRANPFGPNTEIAKVMDSIPKPPELLDYPAQQNIYGELHTPKPPKGASDNDDLDGPPVPPMRLAGIIQGSDRLTAMLQMGSSFMAVHPGQKVPDANEGPYRVDTIEPNRIMLSRRWEIGDRKGVQKVEVPLSDGQRTAAVGGYPGGGAGGYPGGGAPGMPGGYPGGGPGGYPGGRGGYPGGK